MRLSIILLSCSILLINAGFSQTSVWTTFVDSIVTFSSPHIADLNGDNVDDVIIGGGVDSVYRTEAVIALDGVNGNVIWSVPARDEIFASAVFKDITGDNITDVFIGGRSAEFMAINGATGNVIWEFFAGGDTINPADSGWYNFYSAQLIPDQNSDGTEDLLVANGGNHKAPIWDTMRPPGQLMIIDALNGTIIANALTPDGEETYMSPLVADLDGDGTMHVIFGTGGEYDNGGLWKAKLSSLRNNDLSQAIQIAGSTSRGFIAPPALADINGDGTLDIISQGYDGTVHAIDGGSNLPIWSVANPGTESSAETIIGNFTGDYTPDVFCVLYKGSAPSFFDFYQVLIDGATGQVVWKDSIATLHFPSANAFDYNGDGRDEALISVNYHTGYFSHQLQVIDFQNDTVFPITALEPGVNLASTPHVSDIDNNTLLDVIYAYREDSINPTGANGINIKRLEIPVTQPNAGIAWGAYIGSNYDGQYSNTADTCVGGNIIQTISITNTSCNDSADGSLFAKFSGATNPINYVWSNGSVADTLKNLVAGTYGVTVVDSAGCLGWGSANIVDPYVVSIAGVVNNVCEEDSAGSATLSSTGCPCMFSLCVFEWDTGDSTKTGSGMWSGTHFVTITHTDGCVVIDSVEIGFQTVIDSISSQGKNSFCLGDSLQIGAHPNNAQSYQWLFNEVAIPGANTSTYFADTIGDYQVIVTNTSSCTDTSTSITIGIDTLPIIYLGADTAFCQGDSLTLNAGAGFASYLWHMGDTTQTYSVSVPGLVYVDAIDGNGCSGADTINVGVYIPPTVTVVTPTVLLCEGDTVVLSALGFQNCMWQDTLGTVLSMNCDLVVTTTGSYVLTVTDSNGCSAQSNVATLDFYPAPLVPGITTNGIYLIADSATSYQWYLDSVLLPGETDDTLLFITAGDYSVEVWDSIGCSAISAQHFYSNVNITLNELKNEVTVFPNPFSEVVNFTVPEGVWEISLFDISGRVVFISEFNGRIFTFQRDLLERGTYLFQLQDQLGERYIGKLIAE